MVYRENLVSQSNFQYIFYKVWIGNGNEYHIPNVCDLKGNKKTVSPTKLGEELTKEYHEKLGTGIPAHIYLH